MTKSSDGSLSVDVKPKDGQPFTIDKVHASDVRVFDPWRQTCSVGVCRCLMHLYDLPRVGLGYTRQSQVDEEQRGFELARGRCCCEHVEYLVQPMVISE